MADKTLLEAYREALASWAGKRCEATNRSQASKATVELAHVVSSGYWADPAKVPVHRVKVGHVREVTAQWYQRGLSPETINKRLNCLAAMGLPVEGLRKRPPKQLKWWLNPERQAALTAWLRTGQPADHLMADFIDWTCWTGLRVEETLRARETDILGTAPKLSITVQGTKTAIAQGTLPLSEDAARIVFRRLIACRSGSGLLLFPFDGYGDLRARWETCREWLGVKSVPGATLKALRRSAARYLHVQRGMPLDMLRQYLRHEDIQTTMGYLRLTGGYGEEEMRKWL